VPASGRSTTKIQFAIDLTGDRDALVGALDDLGFGNPTRLYDAVDASLDQLQGLEGRRVVVVFTDGDDTASKYSLGRVLQRSRDEEVMVYAVGLESNMTVGGRRIVTRPDRGLRKLAEETGGGFFELKRTSELGPTFTRVAQELRSQCVIGFAHALDGKVHKLEVRGRSRARRGQGRAIWRDRGHGAAFAPLTMVVRKKRPRGPVRGLKKEVTQVIGTTLTLECLRPSRARIPPRRTLLLSKHATTIAKRRSVATAYSADPRSPIRIAIWLVHPLP
jgi:hypothetical protein